MKVQTFEVGVIVTEDKILDIDYNNKVLKKTDDLEFDNTQILFKAAEIKQFNESEITIIKSLDPGIYSIDFKMIVQ